MLQQKTTWFLAMAGSVLLDWGKVTPEWLLSTLMVSVVSILGLDLVGTFVHPVSEKLLFVVPCFGSVLVEFVDAFAA